MRNVNTKGPEWCPSFCTFYPCGPYINFWTFFKFQFNTDYLVKNLTFCIDKMEVESYYLSLWKQMEGK